MNRALCPYCDHKLASDLAQQCIWCGMDWHDPGNIVRRGENVDFVDRIHRMIDKYERGYLTVHETMRQVIDCISQTNVRRIVPLLPESVMRVLREFVDGAPQTDKAWEHYKFCSIQSYCGRSNEGEKLETEDERQDREANEMAKFRHKIDALQAYFAFSDPT